MIQLRETYKKRPIRFLELWQNDGWTMKIYGISYQNDYPNENLVDKAKVLALKTLPVPAITNNRYGVGYIGVHDGAGANFIFIDWWSNENELNHHVYVATDENPYQFEDYTSTGLIACCWDMKVLSFERDSWVQTVLNNPNGIPNLETYLKLQLNEDV